MTLAHVLAAMVWCHAGPACEAHAREVVAAARYAADEWRGVTPELLLAVAWAESRFDPHARTSVAWGVWQLHVRSEWGKRAWAYCTAPNVTARQCLREQAWQAARVLHHERLRCYSWRRALAAYRTGKCDSKVGLIYARRVLRKARRI